MEGESVVATMIDVYHKQGLAAAVWVPVYFIIIYLFIIRSCGSKIRGGDLSFALAGSTIKGGDLSS